MGHHHVALILGGALVFSLATCSFDWDAFDPRQSGAATTSAGGLGGGGGTGGVGGMPQGGAGGVGGVGGQGGSGGAPLTLVDRGLLTRYFIDEAASGTSPPTLADSAPDPLDLALDYGFITTTGGSGGGGAGGGGGGGAGTGGTTTEPNMTFTTVGDHRGLTWTAKNSEGSAHAPVGGSKLTALAGGTEATIECVVDYRQAGGTSVCGRISHLGVTDHGNLMLCSEDIQSISFRLTANPREDWVLDLPSLGRIVLHAVFESSHTDPESRMRLYVDGVDQGPGTKTNNPPAQDHAIALSSGNYVLGNRITGDGSPVGELFYCALYTVALDPAEVANNAEFLSGTDDHPR